MTSKFDFPHQMISRYNKLETHLHEGEKGLKYIYEYFVNVQKDFIKLHKALKKSLLTINNFIKSNNKSDATLYTSLKSFIQNEEAFHKEIEKMCEKYKEGVLETFKIRQNNYADTNKKILAIGEQTIKRVEKSRSNVTKAKEEYHKSVKNSSNAGTLEAEQLNQKMEVLKNRYQKVIEEHNENLDKESEEYLTHLDKLEANEQMRIDIISKNIKNFINITSEFICKYKNHSDKSIHSLAQVDPIRDVDLYSAALSREKKSETFDKMVFEDHGEIYQLINKIRNSKPKSSEEVKDEDMGLILKLINTEINTFSNVESLEAQLKQNYTSLLKGKDMTEKEKITAKETFKSSSGRLWLAESLSELNDKIIIKDYSVFTTLKELIEQLLAQTYVKRDMNPLLFHSALMSGFFVYGKKEDELVSLKELLKNSTIFSDRNQWVIVIQYEIRKEFDRHNIDLKAKKTDKELNVKRSKLFSVLCSIAMKMSLLNVPKLLGKQLLLGFASYYELPSEKLCQLLLEYDGAQRCKRSQKFKVSDVVEVINMKYKKLIDKYDKVIIIIIAKSMGYIGDLKSLFNILLLNKKVNKKLKKRVYRKVLELPKISMEIRKELWKKTIIDNTLIAQYKEIKEQRVKKYLDSGRIAKDVICMDVARSFRALNDKDQEVIS